METPPPPWIELPADLTAIIFQRLDAVEILESVQKVCATWWKLCKEPVVWRVITLKNPGGVEMQEKLSMVCRHAVDRSHGQVIDLTLDGFGDDELLNYVADRSRQLKCLKLDTCLGLTGEGFAEAVKRLPNVEELHLVSMPFLSAEDVESIGISCPMLKSFTLNERESKHIFLQYLSDYGIVDGFDLNDWALAIAKTMPHLRHLGLVAQWMKNEGLEAILDGCPHLESLDIWRCFGLDLRGDLGRRCREKIRVLRCPFDPVRDRAWLEDRPSPDSTFYKGFETWYRSKIV